MLTPEFVDTIASDLFPARGPFASYEYVSCDIGKGWAARASDPDFVRLTVRLITWGELPNGDRAIEDVKEQEIAFAPSEMDADRFVAYLQAWHAALDKALAHATKDRVAVMMPHDFVHADVLKLKTAHTKEDFERAFLQRSRLGAWLPEEMRTPPPTSTKGSDHVAERAAKRASSSSPSSSTDGSL